MDNPIKDLEEQIAKTQKSLEASRQRVLGCQQNIDQLKASQNMYQQFVDEEEIVLKALKKLHAQYIGMLNHVQ